MKKCTNCSNVQIHDLTGECVSCGTGKLVEVSDDGTELQDVEEVSQKDEVETLHYSATEIASVEIITLPVHPSRRVIRTIGIVKGVADLQVGLFSLKSQRWIYESSFESAKEKIAVSALEAGGNAVIGVIPLVNSNNPGSSTFAGGGMKSVETFMLCGTAVFLD